MMIRFTIGLSYIRLSSLTFRLCDARVRLESLTYIQRKAWDSNPHGALRRRTV
jgi:hypothetical protein